MKIERTCTFYQFRCVAMLKTMVVIICFSFSSVIARCQLVSVQVIDAESKKELQGATISFINTNNEWQGMVSNNLGKVELDIGKIKDSVLFSFIGYKTIKISKEVINNNALIALSPIVLELSQIEISSRKLVKKGEAGIAKKERSSRFLVNFSNALQAIYFSNPDSLFDNKLTQIFAGIEFHKKCPAALQLRLFESTENGTPGNEMLELPIAVEISESTNDLMKIELPANGIPIPKNGFFISYQLIKLAECEPIKSTALKLTDSINLSVWYFNIKKATWMKLRMAKPHIGIGYNSYKL